MACEFTLWNHAHVYLTHPLRSNHTPAWECLVNHPHTLDERISLITDHKDTEVAGRLPRDDARSLVDEIDKVSSALSSQKDSLSDLELNSPIVPSRC